MILTAETLDQLSTYQDATDLLSALYEIQYSSVRKIWSMNVDIDLNRELHYQTLDDVIAAMKAADMLCLDFDLIMGTTKHGQIYRLRLRSR